MSDSKYKIAIMGATHVGKTVFFASFFHLVDSGKGKYVVSPKPKAVEEIRKIRNSLFQERRSVAGTDERKDFSFSVGADLNIDVELYDIPGGFTTDAANWENETTRIADDLAKADAALLFISAEDVLEGGGRMTEETSAFSAAIELLRRRSSANGRHRADIPIFVIFTKCDAIPSTVTKEDLLSRIAGLMRNMRDSRKANSLLDSSRFFTKGKNVAAYMTIAMGKWKDRDTPPSSDAYEPHNVLEPMEDIFEKMVHASKINARLYFAMVSAIIMTFWFITIAVCIGYDRNRWHSAKDDADRYISANQYEDAIKTIEAFNSRWLPPRFVLPSFLRAGKDANLEIEDYYKQYESRLFNELQSAISAMDMSNLPSGNIDLIRDYVSKTQEYLSQPQFYEISPNNYDQVKQADFYYFTAQTMLATDEEYTATDNSEQLMSKISKQLAIVGGLPDAWREDVMNRIDAALRAWVRSMPQSPEISLVSRFVDDAEMLMQNQHLPDELKEFLAVSKERWIASMQNIWASNVAEWIREASKELDLEKAIMYLGDKKLESGVPKKEKARIDAAIEGLTARLVQAWIAQAQERADAEEAVRFIKEKLESPLVSSKNRPVLESALNYLYAKLVAQWIQSGMNYAMLRDSMTKQPDMPTECKAALKDHLASLLREALGPTITALNKVTSLKELEALVQEFAARSKEYPESASELAKTFASAFGRVLSNELAEIDRKSGARCASGDFAAAYEEVQRGYAQISIILVGLDPMAGDAIQLEKKRGEVENRRQSSLSKVENAEYDFCRAAFNGAKNVTSKTALGTLAGNLDAFLARWPESSKNTEISMVRNYVKTVANGISGRITIASGYFSDFDRWESHPDTYVVFSIDGDNQGKSNTVPNTKHPQFNLQKDFLWTIDSKLQFSVFEEDVFSDIRIFDRTVLATGLFGYRRLTGELKSGENMLQIKFDAKGPIPPCPWE